MENLMSSHPRTFSKMFIHTSKKQDIFIISLGFAKQVVACSKSSISQFARSKVRA
jgi:hypothetical protein